MVQIASRPPQKENEVGLGIEVRKLIYFLHFVHLFLHLGPSEE
jgi:hypothetical protein